jgi:Family of unknown function (DUF6194)
MDQDAIIAYIAATCPGVEVLRPTDGPGAGDTFFMYQPERNKLPFATIVTKDYGDFDNASRLDRPDVFRLNIGVRGETFRQLFPETAEYDYAALDRLMPHPVYANQHWVCVIKPTRETFEGLKPLLEEAYRRLAGRR